LKEGNNLKDILTLGIETSCDETSVAVVKNGREILSNVIDTQIPIHEKYGGVVPEIASRNHVEAISNVTLKDIDAITPTYGPGLVGALLVGVSYAKALSFANNISLVGVNHIQGHIAANYLTYKNLEPPFLCLLISGGNTQIVNVKNYTEFEVLGKTRDDAIGEAFDKVARVVGLDYPGGPKVDNMAKWGEPNIKLPKTHFENSLDFSFSGIKTAVININHNTKDISKPDLCASFEKTVTEVLIENVIKALKLTNSDKLAIAGGVSANSYIRKEILKLETEDLKIYLPDLKLCTDNAAMIASMGYYNFIDGKRDDLNLNAIPNLKI
jgi:N6-L-threonylcarbamoyladenine synthase